MSLSGIRQNLTADVYKAHRLALSETCLESKGGISQTENTLYAVQLQTAEHHIGFLLTELQTVASPAYLKVADI